jgi:hypothetical protein
MLTETVKERERALEHEFFDRVSEKIREELQKRVADPTANAALGETTGIDENLMTELVERGFSTDSLAALALAPLVLVAWADRNVDASERKAVLRPEPPLRTSF